MRLKRVRIFGFKTFADRTEFDLEGGVVAVVGPNGCGKSNIVDAILWGLGEGNARHLRAQTSQDVIFAGSANRKPVGFAEVTLLFDNEDGALPIDTPEVSITRRLTRQGDSEYSINRQSCRLRDILDLLADSGLGRAGYAIVGQKEIDQALAASAEDRRAWIDEAAGVQRYRSRKIESLRRLSQAHTHLERVGDIISEIESQREPLREEAEVAIRYKSVLQSLREVESNLLVVEIAKAHKEAVGLEAKIADAHLLADKENRLAESIEMSSGTALARIRDLERAIEGLRHQLNQSLMQIERSEGAIKLAEQKLATLNDIEQNIDEERSSGKARVDEAILELDHLRTEYEAERDSLEKLRIEVSGAGEQAAGLRSKLKDAEGALARAREQHALKLKIDAEQAHRTERRKAVTREIKGIVASLPGLEQGLAEVDEDLANKQAAVQESLATRDRHLADLEALRKAEVAEDAQRRDLIAKQSALEGRRTGLEMTIAQHEGLQQGARAVLEAVKQGLLDDVYTPVGEAVTVDSEYAVAIDTALGGAANDLICPDQQDAKRGIELLKQHRLGRATFQPIPLMRPQAPSGDFHRLLGQTGVVGRASDLVQCKASHRPVIDSLLGRVIVVETLDDALRLGKTSGWQKLVTLEGEFVHSAGAVTGGQSAKQQYGLVQRRADLAEIEAEIGRIEGKIKTFDAGRTKRESSRQSIEAKIAAWAEDHKGVEVEFNDTRQWRHSVNDELVSTQRAKKKLEDELAELEPDLLKEIAEFDLSKLEAARDELMKSLASRSADAESATERLRDGETRLAQSQLRLQLGERRLEAAKEQDALRSRRLQNLGPEREKTKSEIAQAGSEKASAEATKAKASKELEEALKSKEQLQTDQAEKMDQAIKARQNAAGLIESAHESELSRARAEARKANSIERLLEEYGMSEEDALALADSVDVPKDAATLVPRLRRELRAMGDVNLGAVEAYERLSTRFDELATQKEDIEAGIVHVQESIRELDKLTRDRFLGTFEQVQIAFAELFQRLFEGGEGALSLADPSNTLESGIEIEVTLPGKTRKRLELLSGGERSLCATAFLFSLLKVKPSPLVILDEVDAPLDGRNVERYVEMLRDFSERSQFIVITHNPTTIEHAPIWLGVTMSEPGVSTLVPTRVSVSQAVVEGKPPLSSPIPIPG